MNRKADKLATILKGRNPAYMATGWFTEPGMLRASLRAQFEKTRPNDPPDAAWRKDPIRAHARAFMEFFLDLAEGAVEGQGSISNQRLAADHFRKYVGDFMGMDPALLSLEIGMSNDVKTGDEEADEEVDQWREIPPGGRLFKFVAVNDEPIILEALQRMFQCASGRVVLKTFTNSDEAWRELSQTDPDLLLTDDAMPGLSGEEICRRLLERKATYPIVVMSPWGPTEKWVRECAGRGLCVKFLAMPFDLKEFRKALGVFGPFATAGIPNKDARPCG